jgi:glucose-1-phosphate cytidylyltransferase
MQVVILCGGQGTRIRDVTEDVPKPMIPIGGRPILWHIMKGYAQHGFTDFILCLGYKSWVIKNFFLDYHLADADFSLQLRSPGQVRIHSGDTHDNWHVTLVETGLEAMTGCRIHRIAKYLCGDHFLLTYGDGVADVNIRHLVDFHLRHGRTVTVTAVRPPSRFGEMELNGPQVVEFNEKPSVSEGWINGGFFVCHRRLLERLANNPGLVFEHEPLMGLVRDGELMAYQHDGFWHPMDTSRDYKFLNELWAQGKAPWKTWDVLPRRAAA